MTVIMCPPPDDEPWPTLGPLVCQWIQEHLCHGPGDLLGQPITLTAEQLGWLYRIYEVEPPKLETRAHGVISREANPRAGKRRFQRCAISVRKGYSKTELAAWIAAAELHPEAPVRCAGWETQRGVLVPTGRAVSDPYIPMIAYTEEQSEELAYGALRRILQEMPVGEAFDIGLERIMRRRGDGKAEAVSSSPNARDGARTTFQHADETHRFTLDGLKKTWTVMVANLAKRPLADPWALETTTAPAPGERSVAETTMEYARAVVAGKASGSRLFFFHREASESASIETDEGLRAAIVEASGPYVSQWTDVDRIAAAFREPDADIPYLERVWLNRLVQATGHAFDAERWKQLARPRFAVPDGAPIVLGFDGGRFDDATALIATHVQSGFQWPIGIWERPLKAKEWEVPADEVDAAVSDAFERYHVCRMYCDPPKWESYVAKWAGQYEGRVAEWFTWRRRQMGFAIRAFVGALAAGELTHDGGALFAEHVGNARRQETNLWDEDESGGKKKLWIIQKERPDSPKKIDAAVAAVISWEARNDAVAAGEGVVAGEPALHFL